MAVNTPQAAETAAISRTHTTMVGAWSVKATVTSAGPFPPGLAIFGLIVFTSDGLVTPLSSCTSISVGVAGCGVWEALPDGDKSFSFSFMEHAIRNSQWVGCNYVYAPEVHLSEDGSEFDVPNIKILKRNLSGDVDAEIATTLHGTRISLKPPIQMPQQIL
jgi:hypothetical protein